MNVQNMTLIVPSKWLADLVKKSYLNAYPVQIVHNTIDTGVFKSTPSDFRVRWGVENRKIILGVASAWSEKKGLSDFIRLSAMLDDRFVIVLVGLSPKQIKKIPGNIIALPRTNNPQELAALYTAADVHLVLSKEETFGMTTIESVSCGTPVIVYKGTACEEVVNEYGGIAVEMDLDKVVSAVYEVTGTDRYIKEQ